MKTHRADVQSVELDPRWMTYRELLLGCGHSRSKRVCPPNTLTRFLHVTTLDMVAECKPDVLFDLQDSWQGDAIPLPNGDDTPDNYYDEIHAYEVLEHIGEQGRVEGFFQEFHEYWRILKPNGYLCATCPWWQSIWAWGDPGHRRIISPATLVFLDAEEYKAQLGKTPMSDYRELLRDTNFKVVHLARESSDNFRFILQAIKQ